MYPAGDYLKVEFRNEQSGKSEWMWVRVENDDPERRVISCVLDSKPIVSTSLRCSQ